MRAVFLEKGICKVVYPNNGTKEEPFYDGMEDISKEANDIKIMQYLTTKENQYLRLGFQVEADKEIIFQGTDKESSFYVEQDTKYKYYIPEKFGTQIPGDIEYFYELDGKRHWIRVHIIPTIKDHYDEILNDLTNISVRLYYCSRYYNRRIKREYLTDYEIEVLQLEQHIKELTSILRSLNQDPMTDMITTIEKRPFRQVKHLDANVIFDHYVMHKPKVRTRVHKKTYNIYENQKIYNFIKLLEQRLYDIEQQINKREKQTDEKESAILGSKESLEKIKNKIIKLNAQMKEISLLEMFHKESFREQKVYPLKSSNLFVNHKKYRQVYRLMQRYHEVGELLETKKEYQGYSSTSFVYEIWCYFKIVEILMVEYQYKIDKIAWPQNDRKKPFEFELIKSDTYTTLTKMIKRFVDTRNQASLEELVIHLVNDTNDIYIGYNCTFQGKKAEKLKRDKYEKTTDALRPDIFLLINQKNFFACDAKYKNYKSDFQGIQAWYADIFECAAHKYIYRLDLESVATKFEKEWNQIPILKNGGTCILTPAIAEKEKVREIGSFRGEDIEEYFEEYLEYLDDHKVNYDLKGKPIFHPEEYSKKLYHDMQHNKNETSRYEYHVASAKFLPGEYKKFNHLFEYAIKYNEDHFS